MPLDVPVLADSMTKAMKGVLQHQWPAVRHYAASESANLAETLGRIVKMKTAKEITEPQARLELDMQRHAARAMLLTVQGMSLLAAEQALNAALAAVKQAVNAAIGFALL